MDGFDQSGVIILKKERSGLEQGHTVGEHVIPLARNFNNVSIDVESWSSSTEKFATELKSTKVMEDGKRGQLQPLKEEALVDTSREAINKKHASLGEHNKQASNMDSVEKNVTSSTADSSNLQNVTTVSSSRIASKWEAVKNGFQNFKSNIDAKRFIHLRQIQETKLVSNVSSSESLDEIFQRLKQPTINHRDYSDDDDDDYLHDHGLDIRKMRPMEAYCRFSSWGLDWLQCIRAAAIVTRVQFWPCVHIAMAPVLQCTGAKPFPSSCTWVSTKERYRNIA
uniref:Uncharacterized protein n=1 Tax=Fagus sylvatica TaxID=28930 RepID=A0A2N9I806_FAGSY